MKSDLKYRQYLKFLIPTVVYKSLTETAHARYLTAAWSFGLIIAGYLILSSQNILTIITPGVYYPFPVSDKRIPIQLTAFDRVHGTEITTLKLILPAQNSADFARRIAFLINEPSLIQDKSLDKEFKDVDNQADLGFSVKKIWTLPDLALPGKSQMIIDLRKDTVLQEVARFTESRGEDKERTIIYLDRYFTSLAETILKNDVTVSSVQFKLDGISDEIPGMQFPLNEIHTLESFK
jgi:hypothetical protein